MKKEIIFIKLGGSVITDKQKILTPQMDVIKSIALQIKKIKTEYPQYQIILGNGAGSYGHYYATKYDLCNGIKDSKQIFGFCEEQNADKSLNAIIVNELLKNKLNIISLHPSSFLISENGKVKKILLDHFYNLFEMDIIPTVYGAIVIDTKLGSHIFSTEDLFEILMFNFIKQRYKVKKIIYLTTVDGLIDKNGNLIRSVNHKENNNLEGLFYTPLGYDVTGGMRHKIETALRHAKRGIETQIISGLTRGRLIDAISGKETIGTVIR